ncbi:GPO family capsid scaffolding protein [Guyparkeria halopsychrophila]|uniref:GPO family capsid scaffolding protein n=1 Tax=Guyparkeria halopsychrophila TaxID=3139421 RepID=UPI0037C7169A
MKFHRVAVSGKTIDGREITPDQINQMAETYNPETYGARIWMEHLRGMLPDSLFPAYGDVTAVEARDWKDPSSGETKRALYASIDALPELKAAAAKRQKVYFSIEIARNFADTGKAYLMGLAMTDSPASLGTEMAAFSAAHRDEFDGDMPDSLYSRGIEADALFNDEQDHGAGDGKQDKPGVLARVRELLSRQTRNDESRFADITQAVELLAEQVRDSRDSGAQAGEALFAQIEQRLEKIEGWQDKIDTLTQRVDSIEREESPNHRHRPPANGGSGRAVTDC